MNIWKWLNGKKTLIGWALATAAPVIPQPYGTAALILGGLLGGVGAVHKVKKGELNKKD